MKLFRNLFENDIGIDLGTENMRVWAKGRGLVLDEPAVVAISPSTNRVLGIGVDAEMIGKGASSDTILVHPMEAGRVRDPNLATELLRKCLDKTSKRLRKPRVILSIPVDLEEERRTALAEMTSRAGARQVLFVEAPLAAAIGADLPVQSPCGTMVVDIGAGKTEAALISLSGVICANSVCLGGHEAERNRDAFEQAVTDCVTRLFETAPPEIAADVITTGIVLTGGSARLPGLAKTIEECAKVPVRIAEDASHAVIRGIGQILDEIDALRRVGRQDDAKTR